MSENQSPTEYFRQRLRDRENFPQYALDEYKIDNLTSIEIKNFKSIKSEKLILKSATFIAGLNSAGKSSFTQALIVILQWINNLSDNKKSYVPLNGAIQQLGNNVYDILNRGSLSQINNEKSDDLAAEIVDRFHGVGQGEIAKQEFAKVFAKKDIPTDMPEFTLEDGIWLGQALVDAGLVASTSQARRDIQAGAVKLNQKKVTDDKLNLQKGDYILQKGKKSFAKIVIK